MKNLNKVLEKMLDNFIIPKFEDIIKYDLSLIDENVFDILFWMDGTDEEIEIDIMSECEKILKYLGVRNITMSCRFTVDGESYYYYQ
jgi:hypothetical protein